MRKAHDIEIVVFRQTDTQRCFTVTSVSLDRNDFLHMASEPQSVTVPNSWVSSFMTNSNTSEPLEICWQVFEASSTRILTCAMFDASSHGIELRVGYLGDSPLRSQIMPDIDSARVLAQDWLDAVRAAAEGN